VLGKITERNTDGMSAEITTTDDARINVTFKEPLDSNALYVEVRGTVKSNSTMSCSDCVCFPRSMTEDFDAKGYNSMVNMWYAVANQLEGAFYGD